MDITKFETPRLQIEKETLICKFCGGKLGIKHGLRRIKHFFHITPCTSSLERHPESVEHILGKELIAEHIKTSWKEYSEVEIKFEYPFQEIGRIADVAMRSGRFLVAWQKC